MNGPAPAEDNRKPTQPSRPAVQPMEDDRRATQPARPAAAPPVEELLDLAARAPDVLTALHYAQRAINLRPDNARAQASVQGNVLKELRQDAFVAYVGETDNSYVVAFRNTHPVSLPKARSQPETYPRPKPTPAEKAWRLVGLMLLGLIPAGLGALALSAVAVPRAAAIAADGRSAPAERRSAGLALAASLALGLAGLALALLLLLHIIG